MDTAAPLAPERVAVGAWQKAQQQVADDLERWARRLADGERPLRVGEARRLESLITTAQTMLPMTRAQAEVAGAMTAQYRTAAHTSLEAVLARVAPNAKAAQADFYKQTGWVNVGNEKALLSAIARAEGAITADFDRLDRQLQERISRSVVKATAEGLGPEEMARYLRKTNDGTSGLGMYRSRLISRTELADVYDRSRMSLFEKHADLLHGYEWDARNDSCPICHALHGRIFPVNEPPNRHHMCRCVSIPVLPDEDLADTPPGEWGPNAHDDPEALANRNRLMQAQAPAWRPYWRLGDADAAAQWRATRPALPPLPTAAELAPSFARMGEPDIRWVTSRVDTPRAVAGRDWRANDMLLAAREYCEGEYHAINDYLRHGVPEQELRWGGTVEQVVADLDELISRSSTKEHMVVFRGVDEDVPIPGVGSIITDHGFASTSAWDHLAVEWTDRKGALWEIELPSGSKAIVGTKMEEYEVLLQRGYRFRVTGHSRQKFTVGEGPAQRVLTRNVVHMRALEPDAGDMPVADFTG